MNLYVVRNKENGKCYVGQTKHPVGKRLYAHSKESKSLLGKAMRKYSEDAFEVFVFAEVPIALIDVFEIQMIALLDSGAPNGYNLHLGGKGRGVVVSDMTRAKISASKKGKPSPKRGVPISEKQRAILRACNLGSHPSEETRRKLSEARRGNTNAKGNKHSAATKKQMSESAKRHIKTPEHIRNAGLAQKGKVIPRELRDRNAKMHMLKGRECKDVYIVCVETGERFDVLREVIEKYSISRSNMGNCLTGRSLTAGGLHWEYREIY